MAEILVLVENSRVSNDLIARHGLSLLVTSDDTRVLLDLGPDSTLLHNARALGVDLASVRQVVLSHAHIDHTGGLDSFCSVNQDADIVLFADPRDTYTARVLPLVHLNIGCRSKGGHLGRIRTLEADEALSPSCHFVRNTCMQHPRPMANASLFARVDGKAVPDPFTHEGLLLIDESDGVIVCNSCSHTGVRNSVETARKLRGKPVKAYVGGLHLQNPLGGASETPASIDALCDYIKAEGIHLLTGHCTGEAVWGHIKARLGPQAQRLSTGASFST